MLVEIKKIVEEKDEIFLLIRCCKPHQKPIPLSKGQEELNRNNKLFEKYTEEHRHEMKEFRKRTQQLHLGTALLSQDGVEDRKYRT